MAGCFARLAQMRYWCSVLSIWFSVCGCYPWFSRCCGWELYFLCFRCCSVCGWRNGIEGGSVSPLREFPRLFVGLMRLTWWGCCLVLLTSAGGSCIRSREMLIAWPGCSVRMSWCSLLRPWTLLAIIWQSGQAFQHFFFLCCRFSLNDITDLDFLDHLEWRQLIVLFSCGACPSLLLVLFRFSSSLL